MSYSRRSLQKGGGSAPADVEFAAALLSLWDFPPDTYIASVDEQGTNNRTFLVRHGQQRYVLRVSGFLSVAEVRAEHRILRRLRQGSLSFQVPEPVAAPGGRTVIGTTAGPAAVCRWLPGVRPGMDGKAAFERFGRAAGLLGGALANVPLGDALRDWRTDPRWVRPGDPPVDVLCSELRSAGMSAEQAEVFAAAARRAGRWWPGTDGLPAQVIHGDLAPSNVLADPDTDEVTGLLDFELAGAGFRVQDILAALHQLHSARRAGLAAPHGGLPARLRLGPPPGAGRGGGAARAAHRPVARLRPVAGRQVARRARRASARSQPMSAGWRRPRGGSRPTGTRSCPSRLPRTRAADFPGPGTDGDSGSRAARDAADWRRPRLMMPPDSYSLEVAAGACHAGGMLSEAEIDSFVADGFVAVRGAVPVGVLRACQDEIWSALAERGVLRDAPATWRDPVVRIPCPESEAFAAAGTQPSLWEAFDQLIGTGRWWRRQGVGGTIPVRFPSQADPGDAGWHIEASYERNGESVGQPPVPGTRAPGALPI